VDIKEFIKELKRVTGNYTLEKHYNAFTRIARNISPSQRKIILNILEIAGNQNMDDLDTGLLLEDIKSFHDRVESGKYYDHWGWDEKTHRERQFGDESWADEMDAFFKKARHAYEKKEYRLAVEAYKEVDAENILLNLLLKPAGIQQIPPWYLKESVKRFIPGCLLDILCNCMKHQYSAAAAGRK